jgi:hypothetical protein
MFNACCSCFKTVFHVFLFVTIFGSLETCKALSSAGCRVILCSRSLKAGNDAVKEEIFKNGIGGYSVTDADVVCIIVR